MFSLSISLTDAAPSPTVVARPRIFLGSRSRWAAERVFEPRTPGIGFLSSGIASAQATTGPEEGATPTSSRPRITRKPCSRDSRSSRRRVGEITAIAAKVRPSATRSRAAEASVLGRPALAQGGGLADALAQEVELRTTSDAVTHNLDLLDARRVNLECALDADAAADAADGDRSADAAATQAHDGALEDLDALAVALADAGRNAHGVAGGKLRQVGAQLFRADLVDDAHGLTHCDWGAHVQRPKFQVGWRSIQGDGEEEPTRFRMAGC